MRYRIAALALLAGLAACGQNAAQLARNADPKVCAASDTTQTLFEILKEHSGIGLGPINNTGVTGKELLDEITLTASEITSKKVDKDAQTVDCNATVHAVGKIASANVDQNVDYEVKPDLSDNTKIIVSVSQGDGLPAVEQVAGLLLQAKQSEEKPAAGQTSNQSPIAPPVLTNAQPASGSGSGDCSITVDGTTYLDIKKTCHIDTSDGQTTINTDTPGPISYFAYISPDGKGGAEISWNSKDKWDKAEEDLGDDFHAQGSCWKNARASICAAL